MEWGRETLLSSLITTTSGSMRVLLVALDAIVDARRSLNASLALSRSLDLSIDRLKLGVFVTN